jgi:hypothetical protein
MQLFSTKDGQDHEARKERNERSKMPIYPAPCRQAGTKTARKDLRQEREEKGRGHLGKARRSTSYGCTWSGEAKSAWWWVPAHADSGLDSGLALIQHLPRTGILFGHDMANSAVGRRRHDPRFMPTAIYAIGCAQQHPSMMADETLVVSNGAIELSSPKLLALIRTGRRVLLTGPRNPRYHLPPLL